MSKARDAIEDLRSIATVDDAQTFTAKPTFDAGIDVTGDIAVTGTVDGRDVAADGVTADAALPKAGGTMTGALNLAATNLLPISTTITDTAVDVFVYDTSKDSDGGAWRKRTQGTSWYNETLNTSARGSRKEFPAVAVIVAEATKVTIYDGDDPAMPMWMVFNRQSINSPIAAYNLWWGANGINPYPNATAISALNGQIWIAMRDANGAYNAYNGIRSVELVNDICVKHVTAGSSGFVDVSDRNTYMTPIADTLLVKALVNGNTNDIAMTVLPNAPIDSATGLPIPTIAVATAGGVSVIKDDGSVVDITRSTGNNTWQHVSIENNKIYMASDLNNSGAFWAVNMPQSDLSGYPTVTGGTTYTSGSIPAMLKYSDNFTVSKDTVFIASITSGRSGLTLLKENPTTPSKGSVAYITSDYNTGYMVGDIKLAALSDTDTTNVVGTNLMSAATYAISSRLSSYSYTNGSSTLVMNDDEASGDGYVNLVLNGLSASTTYVVSWTADNTYPNNTNYRKHIGGTAFGTVYEDAVMVGTANGTITFTTHASDTPSINMYSGYDGGDITYTLSVRLADTDRSVNANGLQVHGTITKSAVATGADLVGYSGFSASNYLEQPYNSDLDFGTGDFSVMGWVKSIGSTNQMLVDNRSASDVAGFSVEQVNISGVLRIRTKSASAESLTNGTVTVATGAWTNFACIVSNNGTRQAIYINGVLDVEATVTAADVGTTSPLWVGVAGGYGNVIPALYSSLALLRISATAPSAAQIKTIYEAEKMLFQENAQATLYGTSDAVTALAHDDSTNLLHVGTSSGRSVFQGLRRVDNTTTAVGAAISASNGLVVED